MYIEIRNTIRPTFQYKKADPMLPKLIKITLRTYHTHTTHYSYHFSLALIYPTLNLIQSFDFITYHTQFSDGQRFTLHVTHC
jgi:hypothetical protein